MTREIESSNHVCPDCGREYTCTPEQDIPYVSPCFTADCISYDPDRDVDIKMGFKEDPRWPSKGELVCEEQCEHASGTLKTGDGVTRCKDCGDPMGH